MGAVEGADMSTDPIPDEMARIEWVDEIGRLRAELIKAKRDIGFLEGIIRALTDPRRCY